MTERGYDAVVVGARCAGSTLALGLAREGLSVLVVDRDELGSDTRRTSGRRPQGGESARSR
jgi:menaquinone-9 beta-reductase